MLRIAGRGEDGTAKAIKTDNEGRVITSPNSNILVRTTLTNTIAPGETVDLFTGDIDHSYFMLSVVLTGGADRADISFSVHFFATGYPTDNLVRSILTLDESVKDVESPRHWLGLKNDGNGRFSDWTPVYGGRMLLRATNHNTEQTRSIRYVEMRGRY